MSELREIFRNAIDLNRYSNSVSRRLIRAYNDAVLDAVDQLRGIDELASPVKAARLRAILAQLNDSLRTWSGDSIATMTEELQGLAVLQSEFAAEQLQKALPAGAAATVGTVEISPALGQAIVTTQPTVAGVVNLSDSFERIARNAVTFQLTLGQEISLPNGEVVREAGGCDDDSSVAHDSNRMDPHGPSMVAESASTSADRTAPSNSSASSAARATSLLCEISMSKEVSEAPPGAVRVGDTVAPQSMMNGTTPLVAASGNVSRQSRRSPSGRRRCMSMIAPGSWPAEATSRSPGWEASAGEATGAGADG